MWTDRIEEGGRAFGKSEKESVYEAQTSTRVARFEVRVKIPTGVTMLLIVSNGMKIVTIGFEILECGRFGKAPDC